MCPVSIVGENEFVIIDIETTGFSIEHCDILEIAALRVIGGHIDESFHSLIIQDEPIPSFITELTGITDHDVLHGRQREEALAGFLDFVGDLPLVGHNISFDVGFLAHNSRRYLGRTLNNRTVDTLSVARDLISGVDNYKLTTLATFFGISDENSHRALADAMVTLELLKWLSKAERDYSALYNDQIQKSVVLGGGLRNKKVAIKTKLKHVRPMLLESILRELGTRVYVNLHPNCNVLIMNDKTYERFLIRDDFDEFWESWLCRAKRRHKDGTLDVFSEKQICEQLDLPLIERPTSKQRTYNYVSAKDIIADTDDFDESHPLFGKACVFTGALELFTRQTAMQSVVNVGGICHNGVKKDTDYLILGDNSFCSAIKDGKSSKQKKAEAMILDGHSITIISESTFCRLLKNELEEDNEYETRH